MVPVGNRWQKHPPGVRARLQPGLCLPARRPRARLQPSQRERPLAVGEPAPSGYPGLPGTTRTCQRWSQGPGESGRRPEETGGTAASWPQAGGFCQQAQCVRHARKGQVGNTPERPLPASQVRATPWLGWTFKWSRYEKKALYGSVCSLAARLPGCPGVCLQAACPGSLPGSKHWGCCWKGSSPLPVRGLSLPLVLGGRPCEALLPKLRGRCDLPPL